MKGKREVQQMFQPNPALLATSYNNKYQTANVASMGSEHKQSKNGQKLSLISKYNQGVNKQSSHKRSDTIT
jgi:hypothetical protein